MDKQKVVYSYNGILFSHEKWSLTRVANTYYNVDETRRHYAKWHKPDIKKTNIVWSRYRRFLLLLLLSRFSRVRLCVTPETVAHQAPLSLGISRREYWSGLPFPSPMHAGMLNCFSRVRLCVTPWTAALQAPLSTGLSRQEYWSGLPFPSPTYTLDSWFKLGSQILFFLNTKIILLKLKNYNF